MGMTEGMDVAQVALYAFWIFFFGLIFWLRREDRREGYPLEGDNPAVVAPTGPGVMIPKPKTFVLPNGHGTVRAPNFVRDTREMNAERTAAAGGAPLEPSIEPLLSGVGPAAWAQRADEVELTRDGHDCIVPMRVAEGYSVSAGPDPRGWKVVGADGRVAGTVVDVWVDRADVMVRYLELELEGAAGEARLIPIPMLRLLREPKQVEVKAILAHQFTHVPKLKQPTRITLLEEEKISAFYAGGRLYAEPKRAESVV